MKRKAQRGWWNTRAQHNQLRIAAQVQRIVRYVRKVTAYVTKVQADAVQAWLAAWRGSAKPATSRKGHQERSLSALALLDLIRKRPVYAHPGGAHYWSDRFMHAIVNVDRQALVELRAHKDIEVVENQYSVRQKRMLTARVEMRHDVTPVRSGGEALAVAASALP